ncbi:MAG: DUF1080 domain-containing protein [Armatimonadetes bacterium CG17_big_fil_post_rev_8_21_14_2_50_66_6]|nr:DUF1080 domain-containing protein [Armatimonadota bacterium]PIW21046.1 MAG: DUF1080 domain-containing protein [Armatimonadetes bacterium CG17_big_fil_post_rev_8_21_14_2_50_66_6]
MKPVCAVLLTMLFAGACAVAEEQQLFNGKDLTGWEGNTDLWSVQDGCITGRTTKETPAPGNTFLIWKGGEVSDFELTLKVKFTTEPDNGFGNSGIQFRSKVADPAKFVVGGYQGDMATTTTYFGMLYEERGRGILDNVGSKVLIKEAPEPAGTLGKPDEILAGLKPTEWNEYRIVAKGSLIRIYVNGRQTIELDDQSKAAASAGVLALQLHAGPPMMVQFKDLVLKPLK